MAGQNTIPNMVAWAKKLVVMDVWKGGNPTGIVTDKRLYDPHVAGSMAPGAAGGRNWPDDKKGRGGIKHATVGTNSLSYLAGGSIAAGAWTCVQYLIPHNTTTVANGKVLNTTTAVFKLVPDGYGCNHAYPASWRGYNNNLNSNFYGFEVENLQDGKDPFQLEQYIKFALVWAFLSARDGIDDIMLVDHGIAAPAGHRTDPWTGGLWDDALFYGLIWEIRRPENWQQIAPFWGVA